MTMRLEQVGVAAVAQHVDVAETGMAQWRACRGHHIMLLVERWRTCGWARGRGGNVAMVDLLLAELLAQDAVGTRGLPRRCPAALTRRR